MSAFSCRTNYRQPGHRAQDTAANASFSIRNSYTWFASSWHGTLPSAPHSSSPTYRHKTSSSVAASSSGVISSLNISANGVKS
ncbi:MAG: hypothetical protein IKG81_12770 [Bacteroidales bacterium]|nr:hypothetical protein [Bacteroidales bacterium]